MSKKRNRQFNNLHQQSGDDEICMGRNCIRELLRHCPERIKKVYVAKEEGAKLADCEDIFALLKSTNSELCYVSKEELRDLVKSDSHQSFVAVTEKRSQVSVTSFLKQMESKSHSLVVFLDEVFDPHNMGAILRAAECFAADAIVWSKNRGVSVTPVVTKTSVGASELLPLLPVSNLVDCLEKFKEQGYWSVLADCSKEAQDLNDFAFPEKTALVLGSEKGVKKLIKKRVDFSLSIPMYGRIDSLNVSQAASLLFYSYRVQFTGS